MSFWRPVFLLGFITTSLSSAFGQTQPSITNVIQADGTVKALYESQPVVTTEFWMFHNNWMSRILDWETLGNGINTFQRRGSFLTGLMTTTTQVSNSANGTAITMTATPSQTITSNADYIGLMLDEGFWAGATFASGISSVVFSPDFTQSFYRSGTGSTITVTRPDGFRLTITTPQPVSWVCRDSRGDGQGFDLRVGIKSGSWLANTSRTYQATLKYSNASATNPDSQVVITEGNDWRPLEQFMTTVPGSALDWRDNFAQPAGSKGWLTVNANGKFVFPGTPNKPERFYGANLTHFACIPSKNEAVLIAERLANLGYNAVRFHHIDYVLTDPTAENSTTIDPERMDRMNFLINELKKRGMYITLDLHSNRKPRTNEVISGNIGSGDYKALLLVSPAARANLLTYCSNLLNTHNPYTGLKWKDDPAIAWISIGNENTPFWMTNPRADIKAMLAQAVGGIWAPFTDQGSKAAVNLALQSSQYLATQLRAMGVKALLTDLNVGNERALSLARSQFDFVDNHYYFANILGWGMPVAQSGTNPMRKIEKIGWFAASRLKGKPFTVSEFDGVAPNQFRGEFALMMGAIGVVQQWDGMWRFQFADDAPRALKVQPMWLFSLAADPLAMATERAIVAMYLRGDVTNLDQPYNIANPLANVTHHEIRNEAIVRQSILAKPIAQVNSSSNSGSGIVTNGISSTSNSQVLADLNNLNFRVSTPNTACVIGSEGYTGTTSILTAKFTKSRASIYVTSVDKKPLASSRRMLLAHLTDVQNTGATFTNQERGTLVEWGSLPHLVKVGSAEVTVKVQSPAYMRVYKVDLSGRRLGTVPHTMLSQAIKFNVNTRDPQSGAGVIYYEIVAGK